MSRKSGNDELQKLREIVRDRMIEKSGGILPIPLTTAAAEIGTSHPSLGDFLVRGKGISAQTAIGIAGFIDRADFPPSVVMRMAGYSHEAGILASGDSAWREARIKQKPEKRQKP